MKARRGNLIRRDPFFQHGRKKAATGELQRVFDRRALKFHRRQRGRVDRRCDAGCRNGAGATQKQRAFGHQSLVFAFEPLDRAFDPPLDLVGFSAAAFQFLIERCNLAFKAGLGCCKAIQFRLAGVSSPPARCSASRWIASARRSISACTIRSMCGRNHGEAASSSIIFASRSRFSISPSTRFQRASSKLRRIGSASRQHCCRSCSRQSGHLDLSDFNSAGNARVRQVDIHSASWESVATSTSVAVSGSWTMASTFLESQGTLEENASVSNRFTKSRFRGKR